jgi:hypothetical protein
LNATARHSAYEEKNAWEGHMSDKNARKTCCQFDCNQGRLCPSKVAPNGYFDLFLCLAIFSLLGLAAGTAVATFVYWGL